MGTLIFYTLVGGILTFMYGPLWLQIIWSSIVFLDVVLSIRSFKKAKKIMRENRIFRLKASEYENLVRIAEHENEDSWLKTCLLLSVRRVREQEEK